MKIKPKSVEILGSVAIVFDNIDGKLERGPMRKISKTLTSIG